MYDMSSVYSVRVVVCSAASALTAVETLVVTTRWRINY